MLSMRMLRTAESKLKFLFHSHCSEAVLFLYVSFKSCCHAFPQVANSASSFSLSCSSGHRLRMVVKEAIEKNQGGTPRCGMSRNGWTDAGMHVKVVTNRPKVDDGCCYREK